MSDEETNENGIGEGGGRPVQYGKPAGNGLEEICRSEKGKKAGRRRAGCTNHLSKASSCDDIARVDEAIEVASGLLYRFTHVIVAVEVEDVSDQV